MWTEHYSEADKRPYWHNSETGQTSWDRPAEGARTQEYDGYPEDRPGPTGGAAVGRYNVHSRTGSAQGTTLGQGRRQAHTITIPRSDRFGLC